MDNWWRRCKADGLVGPGTRLSQEDADCQEECLVRLSGRLQPWSFCKSAKCVRCWLAATSAFVWSDKRVAGRRLPIHG